MANAGTKHLVAPRGRNRFQPKLVDSNQLVLWSRLGDYQPRWLEAYHLYDQHGSELFEQICELPEYYLTRTENGILERHAADVIDHAPVACVAELGAGYSKKTIHLLTEQLRQRGAAIFAG